VKKFSSMKSILEVSTGESCTIPLLRVRTCPTHSPVNR
jgi:hypothetical protein